jgi:hypothetical protein
MSKLNFTLMQDSKPTHCIVSFCIVGQLVRTDTSFREFQEMYNGMNEI